MKNQNTKLPNEFVKKVKSALNDIESLEGEINSVTDDGKESWYQNSIMPIFDDNNLQIGEVIVRYDITQKKIYEKLSITDALTQLYNRRHFNDVLSQEICRASRSKAILCFLILDVDYFKKYNDAYGHKAGDDALVAVADTIKNTFHRCSDFAFRLGGEEFGVVYSSKDEASAFISAELLRTNIEALKLRHSNSDVSDCVTVSVGLLVVDFADTNIDSDGFYTIADTALYSAKENGRNKVVLHESDTLELF